MLKVPIGTPNVLPKAPKGPQRNPKEPLTGPRRGLERPQRADDWTLLEAPRGVYEGPNMCPS